MINEDKIFPLYDAKKFALWAQQDQGLQIVTDLHDAQWLTIEGTMYGIATGKAPGEIQANIKDYLEQFPTYRALTVNKNNFWSIVHEATGLVRVVPETEIVRTMILQKLTPIQKKVIDDAAFELEPYTKNRQYFTYFL